MKKVDIQLVDTRWEKVGVGQERPFTIVNDYQRALHMFHLILTNGVIIPSLQISKLRLREMK